MAWAKLRYIALECDGKDKKYPYVVTAWRNVGDVYCGDRFTAGVADCLIEAWRGDGIEVDVTESDPVIAAIEGGDPSLTMKNGGA